MSKCVAMLRSCVITGIITACCSVMLHQFKNQSSAEPNQEAKHRGILQTVKPRIKLFEFKIGILAMACLVVVGPVN